MMMRITPASPNPAQSCCELPVRVAATVPVATDFRQSILCDNPALPLPTKSTSCHSGAGFSGKSRKLCVASGLMSRTACLVRRLAKYHAPRSWQAEQGRREWTQFHVLALLERGWWWWWWWWTTRQKEGVTEPAESARAVDSQGGTAAALPAITSDCWTRCLLVELQ